MDDPVQRKERPARGEGGCGRQDHEGGRDAAKPDPTGMFVEIAQDDRWPHREPLQGGTDGVELTATRNAEEAEVDRHYTQRRWRVEIDDYGPARLKSRQVQPVKAGQMDARARQERVAVPAKADCIATDGQRP